MPEKEMGGYLQHTLDINPQGKFSGQLESVSSPGSLQEVSGLTMGLSTLAGHCQCGVSNGGTVATTSSLWPTMEFTCRVSDSGCPANSIVVVQTTSSLTTGALLYSSDRKGLVYSTLPDIVTSFVDADMLGMMVEGSVKACMPSGLR
jgi:hypothetical protein